LPSLWLVGEGKGEGQILGLKRGCDDDDKAGRASSVVWIGTWGRRGLRVACGESCRRGGKGAWEWE